jgi:hypothetical protein
MPEPPPVMIAALPSRSPAMSSSLADAAVTSRGAIAITPATVFTEAGAELPANRL